VVSLRVFELSLGTTPVFRLAQDHQQHPAWFHVVLMLFVLKNAIKKSGKILTYAVETYQDYLRPFINQSVNAPSHPVVLSDVHPTIHQIRSLRASLPNLLIIMSYLFILLLFVELLQPSPFCMESVNSFLRLNL
jgi:hypothetical protein